MAVIRINKTSDYTIMSNNHFKEREMSLKAKGLLSLMLSLPDNWDYSIAGLVAICRESEKAITTALNELKQFGYLVITKKMSNETESGRIEYEYNIFEHPNAEKQDPHFVGVENVGVENVSLEKVGQLNTKESNTKELNKKESNTKKFNTKGAVYYPDNEQLNDLFIEYIKMRKTIKKPLTENGIKRKMIKLDKLAGLDNDIACKIIEQAIDHCWQDFYPLKDNKLKQQTSQLDAIMNA